MANKLPWFRTFCRLALNPKFFILTEHLQACLLKVWCCAYDQNNRGYLPKDLRLIAAYLGGSYGRHKQRILQVLEDLHKTNWLDCQDGIYRIHDWEYWQDRRTGVHCSTPEQGRSRVAPVSAPELLPSGDTLIDNKELKPNQASPREIESKIRGTSYLPLPETHVADIREKLGTRKTTKDPRYDDLLAHVAKEWQEWRSCQLSSVMLSKDYAAVHKMLHRTSADAAYSLDALKASFTRFASSIKPFERKQSIMWWTLKVHVFMVGAGNNGNGLRTSASKTKTAQSQIEDDGPLEWWLNPKFADRASDIEFDDSELEWWNKDETTE
jgi:hypothetical protein